MQDIWYLMLYVTSSWVRGGILSVTFLWKSEPASNDLNAKQESQPFLNQSSQLSRLLEHKSYNNDVIQSNTTDATPAKGTNAAAGP